MNEHVLLQSAFFRSNLESFTYVSTHNFLVGIGANIIIQ